MTSKPGMPTRKKPAGSAPSRPTTGLRPAASSTTNCLTSAGSRSRGSPRRSCPTRNRTPTISPGSGENVVGTIHMSWAKSGAWLRAIATTSAPRRRNIDEHSGGDIMVVLVSIRDTGVRGTAPANGDRSDSSVDMLRDRDVRYGRNVDTTVPLQQTLVRRSQEREPVEIVLVVDFDAFGEAGRRVTRHNQADQHAVHIHLIAVRRRPTAKAPAVGEHRIDGRVEGDDVSREAVGDRDGPIQVDDLDDVHARALELGHGGGRNAQCLVDTEG